MAWTWDPDTFGANWFNDGNDRMPAPLRYRSRFPTLEELEDHRRAVRAGYDFEERRHIDLLVETVAKCDMRVEIIGSSVSGPGGDGRTARQYRIVGAYTRHHAAVLRQSVVDGEYGDISAQLLRPEQLPAALGASVPGCPPGSQGTESFHHQDLADGPRDYLVAGSSEHPRDRFLRRTQRPADGGGQAVLRLGDYHARPSRHEAAQWYDLTGDGRYLELRTTTHLTITPADARLFTEMFTAWFGQAVRLLGEQAHY